MKLKRAVSAVLAAAMSVSIIFTGCSQENKAVDKGTDTNTEKSEPVNLVYYTIGDPDNDLKVVNEELNKLLKEKINVTVQYNKISWGDYGTKISALVNSGADFDIAFATGPDQGDYAGNADKGAWLDLSPYLQKEGKEMYDVINPLYWEGAKIGGKIYGVPTNKEIAVPEWWMYPKEIIDKYNIDISKYTTLESLEPLFAKIKKEEPEWLPMELDKMSRNFFCLGDDGYEYLISNQIPLMVKSSDKDLKVENIFETDLAKNILGTLRKYYKAGYINEDAAVRDSQGLEKGKKVFLAQASGGPYSDSIWSTDRGYQLVAQQLNKPVVTTESARGGMMVVNARTKNPEACVKFLNLLNTDPEVRNLINYGVEGVHYKINEDKQVERIADTYAGVTYTQGNWFILNTLKGDPKDKWDKFKEFNDSAVKSEALGFTPDTSKLTTQIAAITHVWSKYYPTLMTGSVDPETQLPKFNQELKDAGIDEVKTELQKQIDEWKASK